MRLYGAGAANATDTARLDEAQRRAEAAARRHLRGRVRALFAHTVARMLGEARETSGDTSQPPEPARLVARALLGEPGQPSSRAQRIAAHIEPAVEPVSTRQARRLTTVYALHEIEVHLLVEILYEGLRALPGKHPTVLMAKEANGISSASPTQVFATLVRSQRDLWGDNAATLPQELEAPTLPAWTERVPDRPEKAAFGLGRTVAEAPTPVVRGDTVEPEERLGELLPRLQAQADREARLHLRESLWLTLAWMLDRPFAAHLAERGTEVAPYVRLRWLRSVAKVVAGLAVFAAEEKRLLMAPPPGERGAVRAYTLKRVELERLLAHLERELAEARPPEGLHGERAEPWQPSRRQLRQLWLETHNRHSDPPAADRSPRD